jgi:hypothetical protein
MKRRLAILLALLICLLAAAFAVLWASKLMDSLFSYRSPLHASPPAPGEKLGQPLTRQIVFVLVDALRLDTAMNPEAMPYLHQLRQQGAWASMHSRPPSYSQPGYSTLLIGAWPDLNDAPAMNIDVHENIPTWTQDNLFSAAHRAGLKTAIAAYYWFEKLIPQSDVSASYYTQGDELTADRRVIDAAIPWIKSGDYQLVMLHFDQVDYAGHHEGGPLDPRWDASARQVDDLLREIAASLDLTQDTLLVVSDHGQINRGGHGGNEPDVLVEPFLLIGVGVKPGIYGDVQMVDVAPTLSALLGTNLPASTQGRVLVDMLDLSATQNKAIQSASLSQQNRLLRAYQYEIGRVVAPELVGETVAAHQAALEAARQARLNSERLPRAILVVLLVILVAFVLYRWQGRDLVWMVLGALLYMLVFNFLYLVPAGRTYSLSVLKSASDLILSTVGLVLVSLLAGWLLTAWNLKPFQRSSLGSLETGVGYTLSVIFLLSLPVAWSYVLNGALVGWTLPDFSSSFMAFISLFQILFVVVFGLLLTGLTALIVRQRSSDRRSRKPARSAQGEI